MPKLELPLIGRSEVARQTLSFEFDTGKQGFAFESGQYVNVTLPELGHDEGGGRTRTFSLASSPRDVSLLIATRMTRSGFKQTLAGMKFGTKVTFEGPEGSFTLPKDPGRGVLLFAGGIGITPFRSMIHNAIGTGSPRRLTLVYSNRTPEDAPFLRQLQAWAEQSSHFTLIATMTRPEKSAAGWSGRTGYIDAALVRELVANDGSAACYLAGPPRFVGGLQRVLGEAGMAGDRIQTDPFDGY